MKAVIRRILRMILIIYLFPTPLVKTRCCQKWVCCDTAFLSYQGGGRCQFEHEHYSICHFHTNDGHKGKWFHCDECRDFFGEEQFKREAENPINAPLLDQNDLP